MRALPARRTAAWIAAVGTAAVIAGAAGGAWAVTGQRPAAATLTGASAAPVTLAYTCRFPAGTYRVDARVTASYPARAVAGRPIRPDSVVLSLTVPAAAAASLGPPGAPVTVAARLASGVATTTAAPVVWATLTAPAVPLPAAGQSLGSGALRPTAPLPALTAQRAGPMTVTAEGLRLVFRPRGTASASPGATAAPAATAACALERGQDAALATVAVRGAPASRAASPSPFCPALPPGGLKLNRRLPPPPEPPPGSTVTFPSQDHGCAYIKGYSDVRKLNGAALVGPGLINLAIGVRVVFNLGKNYFQEDSVGQIDYKPCRTCRVVHALPPAHATFLAFGFVPVSATLQLTEIGTINIYGVGTGSTLTTNTSWTLMSLHISDVKVNGQPLDVGAGCQTEKPLKIGLTGFANGVPAYSLQGGGPLTGTFDIPPFKDCTGTENLDPLFTGAVSGPGNFAMFTQGPLCDLILGQVCPPQIPKPLH